MPIIFLICSIVLLLVLITLLKVNAFIALVIAALFVGIANRMPFAEITNSLSKGIGSTLGPTLMVLAFGVMFGSLLSETGAAQKISTGLIIFFGAKHVKLAMLITGFVVGIAMFYNAGFIVLIPLVFSVALQTGQPVIYLGIALCSALSVTHGFLPPHPGPTAIANIFKADIGKTLSYGLIIALPTLLFAGIIFPEFLKKIKTHPPIGMFNNKELPVSELPSFGTSLLCALIPILLMGLAAISDLFWPTTSQLLIILKFIGDPGISMLIALLIALFILGIGRGIKMKLLMDKASNSLQAITTILLLIAAGGAFKQILTDSGTGTVIANYFSHSTLSPLFLGWLIATLIRVALGSATVAGLTAAGIVQPLIAAMHVRPELMVLSIGAGSLMCSHVNDTGFWMFKEYFGLSLGDTFRTWTMMETIVGITGLIGVLVLNAILQ